MTLLPSGAKGAHSLRCQLTRHVSQKFFKDDKIFMLSAASRKIVVGCCHRHQIARVRFATGTPYKEELRLGRIDGDPADPLQRFEVRPFGPAAARPTQPQSR